MTIDLPDGFSYVLDQLASAFGTESEGATAETCVGIMSSLLNANREGFSQIVLLNAQNGQTRILKDFFQNGAENAEFDVYGAGLVIRFPDAKARGYGI